ncbi:MAG: ABC transporter permease, partial [Acidobacteriota bacterium]
ALPGVDAVGLTTALPGEAPYRERVVIEPAVEDTDARSRVMAAIASVDPDFFTALDARPLVGRLFRPADLLADAPPVAIVDRAFAERHFAGASPLGHRLRLDDDGESGRTFEVVGVVADLGLSPTDPGGLYLPLRGGRGVDLLLRVAGEPLTFAGALRAEVGAHDSTATLRRIQPLDAVAKDSATTLGAVGGAAVLAGGSALVLSWLGLFAVTALRVTERRREIGVRRALGARNIQILAWLGRRTLIRVALGAALGAVAFLLLHRALVSAELGLASRIVDLPLVGLAFVVGAALATAGPAVRALRIDPARALGAD